MYSLKDTAHQSFITADSQVQGDWRAPLILLYPQMMVFAHMEQCQVQLATRAAV